jgi:hypothetical protein
MKSRYAGVTFGPPVVEKRDQMVGPDGKMRELPTVAEHKARGVKDPQTGQPVDVDFGGFADTDRVQIRFPVTKSPAYSHDEIQSR